MIYSYAGFPERTWGLFKSAPPPAVGQVHREGDEGETARPEPVVAANKITSVDVTGENRTPETAEEAGLDTNEKRAARKLKLHAMSNLSIVLTLMSIIVAFRSVSKSYPLLPLTHLHQHLSDRHHGSYPRDVQAVPGGGRAGGPVVGRVGRCEQQFGHYWRGHSWRVHGDRPWVVRCQVGGAQGEWMA
jgi:hypothetical protein